MKLEPSLSQVGAFTESSWSLKLSRGVTGRLVAPAWPRRGPSESPDSTDTGKSVLVFQGTAGGQGGTLQRLVTDLDHHDDEPQARARTPQDWPSTALRVTVAAFGCQPAD